MLELGQRGEGGVPRELVRWVGALWVPGLPEVQPRSGALSQTLGSLPPCPLPPLGLPLSWRIWPVVGLDPLEDLWSVLVAWLRVEEDLFHQTVLVGQRFLQRKGEGDPSQLLFRLSLPRGGTGSATHLCQTVLHGCIVPSCGRSLGYHGS